MDAARTAAIVAACVMVFGQARAGETDRIANIERAASEIGTIEAANGADGAMAAVQQCYASELPAASSLTPRLEACMTQDLIVSKVSAAFYGRLDADMRKRIGSPEPDEIRAAMVGRVVGVFARFKVAEADGVSFNALVDRYGVAAYAKARFPR